MSLFTVVVEIAFASLAVPFDGAPGVVSPSSLGEGHLRAGLGWSGSATPFDLMSMADSSRTGSDSRIGSLETSLAWGVSSWTDLGISAAYHFESGLPGGESSSQGFGDTWLHLRQEIPLDAVTDVVRLSMRGRLGLPTGERGTGVWPRDPVSQPRGSTADLEGSTAFGGAGFSWGGSAGLGLDFARWDLPMELFGEGGIDASLASGRDERLHAGAGFVTRPASFPVKVSGSVAWSAPLHQGDSSGPVRLRVGAGAAVGLKPWLSLQGEIWGAPWTRTSQPMEYRQGPRSQPVMLQMPNDAPAGFSVAMVFDFRGPDPDADHDGIPDRLDRCPTLREDIDGFEDGDGCPDPDNDSDGICDPWVAQSPHPELYSKVCRGSDRCPNLPEDIDGFQDEDGCPDPDNDGDGICDPWVSKTPHPEIFSNLCRALDRCPDLREDFDGFEDEDGCPDPDNDKDGIPDLRDACPNQGFSDSIQIGPDGCPIPPPPPVVDTSSRSHADTTSARTWTVRFATGSDSLDAPSNKILDSAAARIRMGATVVQVVGHTDSRGDAEDNQDLSERRARRVAQALVDRGVTASVLKARGRNFSDPAELNFEDQGRAGNRRCEIRLGGANP